MRVSLPFFLLKKGPYRRLACSWFKMHGAKYIGYTCFYENKGFIRETKFSQVITK
jgi:hypothetical protein